MKQLLAVLALTGLTVTLAGAAVKDELETVERNWAKAVVAKDYAALERLYADDLLYAHSTGAVENKKEYLDRLKGGAQKYDRIDHEQIKVIPHGNMAITHSIMRMNGTTNGTAFNNHIMMLHVWVKQGNAWRLVAHQTTRLDK